MLATLDPQTKAFRDDVLAGLSAPIPAIPARWLYDHRGSELFDEITRLPSYYPTRTETAIFHDIMPEVAARIPKGAAVVEFGAGSSTKTPILLEAIAPAAYVPVDISGDYLEQSAADLQERISVRSDVIPVVADFARPFSLARRNRSSCPSSASSPARPSAISSRGARPTCCASSAALLGPGAQLLIGMDRVKPVERLIAAYDDPEGVTAEFNLNLLTRINRELDGDIPLDAFRHEARWNDILSRIEMHLVATRDVELHDLGPKLPLRRRLVDPHREQPQIRPARRPRAAARRRLDADRRVDRRAPSDFAEILADAEPERFAP